MVRSHGKILERTAHRLEGCECHRQIWTAPTSWAQKKRMLKRKLGYDACHLKGRQGAWFQAVGYEQLLHEIGTCSSDLLQELFGAMEGDAKFNFVRLQTELAEALKEELKDKFSHQYELPYCLIRIFYGEIVGGSTVSAKQFARDACAKFDSAVAAGRGPKLHRVAHLALGEGECREQLEEFANHATNTLRHYPIAYAMIRRYALIPTVGRRVEAVHSEIKRIGLSARNMSPSMISASLSESKNLALLKKSTSFRELCVKHWRSNTLHNTVLQLVLPAKELDTLTTAEKIEHIYQCSNASEFKDVNVEQQQRQQWLVATSAVRRSGPRQMPKSWSLAVSYLKAKFVAHVVFSLPKALCDLAVVLPNEADINFDATDPWSSIIDICAAPPLCFNFNNIGSIEFFEVLNANPERRQNVVLHHLDAWTDIVHIMRRRVVARNVDARRVILLSEAGTHETMHLRTFLSLVTSFLPNLYMWKHGTYGAGKAARGQPQGIQVDDATSSMLAPSVSDVVASLGSTDASASSSSLSTTVTTRDVVAMRVLEKIDRLQSQLGLEQVPFRSLEDVPWARIEALAREGALSLGADEFGDSTISVMPSGIRHVSLRTIYEPIPMIRVDACASTSKLDMVLTLLRHGWVSGQPAMGLVRGGEKVFLASMSRPASYFQCLLRSAILFNSGVECIPHDARDLVYQGLLRLSGDALVAFLERLASGGADDQWLRTQLKGTDPAGIIIDDGDEPPPAEDEPLPLLAPLQDMAPPPLVGAILDRSYWEWRRAIVIVEGEARHKVVFDHCSSASGKQRGYINCKVAGHNRCFLWRDCDHHDSREDFCAYLMAWALKGRDYGDRFSHMQCPPPTDARVAAVKGTMTLEDW